jgi:hypothetical protein
VALLAVVEIKFTSLANVASLRHIQNLCGFSTPTAMGQLFIMTLYIPIYIIYGDRTIIGVVGFVANLLNRRTDGATVSVRKSASKKELFFVLL